MLGKTKPRGLTVHDSLSVLELFLLVWVSLWYSRFREFPYSLGWVSVYMVSIRINKRWYHRGFFKNCMKAKEC